MHDLPEYCRVRLSPAQQRRHDSDIRTLAASRVTDLAALTPAAAIELIEHLRSALDDSIQLMGELIEPT